MINFHHHNVLFFYPKNHPVTTPNHPLNLIRVFSPQMFSCVGLCYPTQHKSPSPIFLLKAASGEKKHLSHIVKKLPHPTPAASSRFRNFTLMREEEWRDEKQGEEVFDFCISILRFPPCKKGTERFPFDLYSPTVCVSKETTDVRGLLTSRRKNSEWSTDLITRRRRCLVGLQL